MGRIIVAALLISLPFAAPHSIASEGKLYKWTDKNGVVHYGDRVPPEYARARTEVLNTQGVIVRVREAQKTPEQLAEEMRLRQLEEERVAAEAARRAYDRALIDSYTSVDEIRATRERRLAAVESQITFTIHHVNQLKNRRAGLEKEIQRLEERQRKKGVESPQIPVRLASEMAEVTAALAEHEENLEAFYLDQARIRIKYAEDIERYRALRGMAAEEQASGTG